MKKMKIGFFHFSCVWSLFLVDFFRVPPSSSITDNLEEVKRGSELNINFKFNHQYAEYLNKVIATERRVTSPQATWVNTQQFQITA